MKKNKVIVAFILIVLFCFYLYYQNTNLKVSSYEVVDSEIPKSFDNYKIIIGGLVSPNQGFFPKYDKGLFKENSTSMIVSRGIGNSIIPFRVNNRPELVIVNLKTD